MINLNNNKTKNISFKNKLAIYVVIFLLAPLLTPQIFPISTLKYTVHKGITELKSDWGQLISTEEIGTTEKWIFDAPNQTTIVYLKLVRTKDGKFHTQYDLKLLEVIELLKRHKQKKRYTEKTAPNKDIVINDFNTIRKEIKFNEPLGTYIDTTPIDPSY